MTKFNKIFSATGKLTLAVVLIMFVNYISFLGRGADFSPAFQLKEWRCPALDLDSVYISSGHLNRSLMDDDFSRYFRLRDSSTLDLINQFYPSAVVQYDQTGFETEPNHWKTEKVNTNDNCVLSASRNNFFPFIVEFSGRQDCQGFGASYRRYAFYFFGWRMFGSDRGGCT